jgi:hypothetical protein
MKLTRKKENKNSASWRVEKKKLIVLIEGCGCLTADSFIVRFLKDRGWTWGGNWASLKDYQHFEKI